MDRNRETRRLAAASTAMNNGGGSLSRRRQRSSLRDSPEDDGPGEIQETGRLRDRTVKKDRERDRERSSRSKRRRGDRSLNGSGRDEGDETTEESLEDDEEDEDDDAITGSSASAVLGGGGSASLPPVRPLPSPAQPLANSAPPSMSLQNHHHHHHHRKSFPPAPSQPPPAKPVRTAPWRGADDMIGLSVPRKARSAAPKRSHEWLVSGGGSGGAGAGGGGGAAEQIHRQSSTSPARMSGASFSSALPAAAISPTSSNASVRKKKPIGLKPHRPPKVSKTAAAAAPSSEIEIEVAEVLYGLTRQFKQEPNKPNQRDGSDGSAGVDPSRSRVSSPISISTVPSSAAPPQAPHPTIGRSPKRKRPRQIVNYEEESGASPHLGSLVSSAVKSEAEQIGKREAPSPRDEKNNNAAPAVENGGGSHDLGGPPPVAVEPPPHSSAEVVKSEVAQAMEDMERKDRAAEDKEEIKTSLSMLKEPTVADSDVNVDEASVKKTVSTVEKPREEKFRIDLMVRIVAAPPPLKPSPEMDGIRDFSTEHKSSLSPAIDLVRSSSRSMSKGEATKAEEDKAEVQLEKMGERAEIDSENKKSMTKERVTLNLLLLCLFQ
ncbi:Protein TIME FOR COFFEE [Acorus calamus]|uniref:Protein TIME FOR COFFEE n=1 Tax=Acorus calamus TaxID=4465 RepID=A0AAV9C0F5_ACOCL|nr:Protein TIME FOR COFFEE [Acorus calamus]